MYPALAVLQAIENEIIANRQAEGEFSTLEQAQFSALWVGSLGGMEQDLVTRVGLSFQAIPAAGVHGVGLRALPGNLVRLVRGYFHSKRIIKAFRPDVIFFTGGYVAVPMALAGMRIPMAVYVPDIEPGLALKFLAKIVDLILVTAEASRSYFSSRANVKVAGYPTRPDLKKWNRDEAMQALGLQDNLPVLFVFGGSSGARSINQAVWANLTQVLEKMQVVHITGKLDWSESGEYMDAIQDQLPDFLRERYHPFPYLYEEMGAAFTVADLVVARAGASTLGEFPEFGLPAVLAPYPHAWRYQQVNAEYLAKAGAAKILADGELKEKLVSTVLDLISNPDQLNQMRIRMRSLAKPEAARIIGQALFDLSAGKGRA